MKHILDQKWTRKLMQPQMHHNAFIAFELHAIPWHVMLSTLGSIQAFYFQMKEFVMNDFYRWIQIIFQWLFWKIWMISKFFNVTGGTQDTLPKQWDCEKIATKIPGNLLLSLWCQAIYLSTGHIQNVLSYKGLFNLVFDTIEFIPLHQSL